MSAPRSATVHHGVRCDGKNCQQGFAVPFTGIRYKCGSCFDTDFCSSCEPEHDPTHFRLMYRVSITRGPSPARDEVSPAPQTEGTGDQKPASATEDGSAKRLSEVVEDSYDDLIRRLESHCTGDEKNLVKKIADLRHVPDDYSHIHLNVDTINALETNVHMSLSRRSEFNYGVLQHNRLTGAVIFGPPGTGKTLLPQAVARKCSINMLSISSGDIFNKYWGNDEKAIRAAFSLARKLYPCIMFVDEADGILGKRQDDDKKFVRSMLSEFLREWDGAGQGKERNPFVLLATNMPWDLDPAVLRRAPARILIDVPTVEEREGILGVLLRNERLGEDVTVGELAVSAQGFTGSDLKNLCVSAAMKCVRDQEPDGEGKYPEKRVLCNRHFDFAFRHVKPSVSDDSMSQKLVEFQKKSRW